MSLYRNLSMSTGRVEEREAPRRPRAANKEPVIATALAPNLDTRRATRGPENR